MLLSTQNTHAERLIHLGLNQEAVEAEDVTLQFAFPRKLSGLRDIHTGKSLPTGGRAQARTSSGERRG